MRTLYILWGLLISGTVFSQASPKPVYLKEIGYTFTLPEEFKSLDSAKIVSVNKHGKQILDSVNNISSTSTTKTIFAAETFTKNYFDVTITPFIEKAPGTFSKSIAYENNVLYKTYAAMQGAEVDSATSQYVIDGLSFIKFEIKVSRNKKAVFTSVSFSTLYKGIDISISYIYQNLYIKEQIEQMLEGSKFIK